MLVLIGIVVSVCATALRRELHSRNTAITVPPQGLVFTPKVFSFGRVLPGEYAGKFVLTNTSNHPLNNIMIRRSCFCVLLDGKEHLDHLLPGESVDIRFRLNAPVPMVAEQALFVSLPTGVNLARAEIKANVASPLPQVKHELINLPVFMRKIPSQATEKVFVDMEIAPEVQYPHITTDAPWLHLSTSKSGKYLRLTAGADKFATEGSFDVPAHLNYINKTTNSTMDIALSGTISSEIHIDPACVSFGLVSITGGPRVERCTVHMPTYTGGPVLLRSTNTELSATIAHKDTGDVILDVHLSPDRPGEIKGNIELLQNRTLRAIIPVSAFIQK